MGKLCDTQIMILLHLLLETSAVSLLTTCLKCFFLLLPMITCHNLEVEARSTDVRMPSEWGRKWVTCKTGVFDWHGINSSPPLSQPPFWLVRTERNWAESLLCIHHRLSRFPNPRWRRGFQRACSLICLLCRLGSEWVNEWVMTRGRDKLM